MSEWLNLAMYLCLGAAVGTSISAWVLNKKHRQALLKEVQAAENLAKAQGQQEGIWEGQTLKAEQLFTIRYGNKSHRHSPTSITSAHFLKGFLSSWMHWEFPALWWVRTEYAPSSSQIAATVFVP